MGYLSFFLPKAPWVWVYMLQQVEYGSRQFVRWIFKFPNLSKVQRRQTLDLTARAKLLVGLAYFSWVYYLLAALYLIFIGYLVAGIFFMLVAPMAAALFFAAINYYFGILVVSSKEAKEIARARKNLEQMKAIRIAVLGSYGKTTMKEILTTVISAGKKVGATPGNKNVLISHARWINNNLNGDEDVLVFEYGEARPGDIKMLAGFSEPDIAIITGLAPAHMEDYGSFDAIAEDFKDIFKIKNTKVFVNAQSPQLMKRIKEGVKYSAKSVEGWTVNIGRSDVSGTKFEMKKGKTKLKLETALVGRHLVGPLALAAKIAEDLGLDDGQIIAGVKNTRPFEHRMQPYQLSGAWVVDDTYNGNLEGMKAGLELLKSSQAKRKIYVTPGLVEQGSLKRSVHNELGQAIAAARPDKVVLMKNSVTQFIVDGMKKAGFKGELQIESSPLDFYNNLEHFVAAGDLVLMQNDWTDNYQ